MTSRLPRRIGNELLAELRKTASAGRADAADRHAERLCDGRVVRAVRERYDPQQCAATFGQPADVLPEAIGVLLAEDLFLRPVLLGRQDVVRLEFTGLDPIGPLDDP